MKVALIGAGSTVFAKTLIGDLLSFPELADGTIVALMDIDEERLPLPLGAGHRAGPRRRPRRARGSARVPLRGHQPSRLLPRAPSSGPRRLSRPAGEARHPGLEPRPLRGPAPLRLLLHGVVGA